MGAKIRWTLILGSVLFGAYLAVGYALVDLPPVFFSAPGLAATYVAALALVGVVVLPRRRVTGAVPSGRDRATPASGSAAEATGEDYCILFIVPKRGAPPISDDLNAQFAQAANDLVRNMGGVDTEAIVVLPKDWPYHPVADAGVFDDPAAMRALAKPISDILAARGLPQETIDAFVSGPRATYDHGPVISVYAILPKRSATDGSSEPDPAPHPVSTDEPTIDPSPGKPEVVVVAFILHPEDSLAAAASGVEDLRPGALEDRLRTELALPDAPVTVYRADDWRPPTVASASDVHSDTVLRQIVDRAVERLEEDGVDGSFAAAELADGAFETLLLPTSGRVILFRALVGEARWLGSRLVNGQAVPTRPNGPEAAASAPDPAEPVILLFLGLVSQRDDLPDTLIIGRKALATIAGQVRETLEEPDALIATLYPDDWAPPNITGVKDALDAENPQSLIMLDTTLSALADAGCAEVVLEQAHSARLSGLEVGSAGLYALFTLITVPYAALGPLRQELRATPKARATRYQRPFASTLESGYFDLPEYDSTSSDLPVYASADFGNSFTCDVCGDEFPATEMFRITPQYVTRLTSEGFVPANLPASVRAMVNSQEQLRQAWRLAVASNDTDWGVCKACSDEIDRFEDGR